MSELMRGSEAVGASSATGGERSQLPLLDAACVGRDGERVTGRPRTGRVTMTVHHDRTAPFQARSR